MWDISILYEFSLICSSFGCPQNGDTCGVLFRDLFHASQIYSAFMAFLFLLLILSQAYNEIILFKTWFLYDHCNWFASPDWSSLTFFISSCLFQDNQVNSSELSILERFSFSQLSNLKSKLFTAALIVKQFSSLWSEGSWYLSSYLILSLMNYQYLNSWGLSPILKVWHGVKLSSQYYSHVLNNILAMCLFLQQF